MGKTDSYLNHAIMPPSLKPIHAPRPRLVNDLNRKLDKKLILISAAAGFGKTTLLAEFTAQADRPVSWVRLTDADQDVMRLAEILWSSLVRRFRRLRNAVRIGGLAGASPSSLARVIVGAVADRVNEPFVVIFDDAHRLNVADECKAFLASFISDAPPGMTILAAGRELLDVPLVQLLAADKLATFDSDSLTLRADELADVVARRTGESVSEAMVGDLMEETGGWVTGVLLSERLVSHQVPSLISADEPLAYEYLATAVFDRQPEAVQRFLLDSSVLPVMTADLCDAVLEREDSGEMLEDMLARGLFISVTDDQPTTYEYHHLFRGFLEKRSSRRKPERRRGLARKAGSILANHEEWVERGVELLIDAGNLEELVGTIEAVAPGICRKGRVETVRNWTRVLTDADRRSVALELLLSRSLSDLGRRQEALQILEALSKKGDKCDVQVSDDVERDRLYTLGEILSECEEWEEYIRTMEALGKLSEKSSSPETLVSYYALKAKHLGTYLGRWSEAAQIIDKAIRSYNGAEALSLVSLLTTSSYVYTYLGRLDLGRSRAEDAYRLCKDQGRLVGQARILNNLAYQHHLDGDYSGAINLILDATRVAERLGNVEVVDLTRITLIEILGDLGRKQESADLCAKVVARALDQHESPYWKKYALALDSCLRRRRGDLAGALRSIRKGKDFARGSSHSRLVTEQVGLLSVMNPQRVKGEVWASRRKVAFTQQDWTLVLYFLARSLFTLHERTRAAWWARASIRQSSTRGAVQLVAAELVADPEFLTFVEEALAKEPAWAQIHERISMIQDAGAHLHYELENIVTKRGGLTIEALGVSRVHLDGVEVTTLSPQETRLLIVLADLGQTRSEALGEMFWPKAPYENQMRSLHTAVYHLRNALGRDVIQHASGGGYRLVEDFVRSFDVANFEQGVELATRLSPSRLEWSRVALEALALYKGEYLAGESDVWAVARRRELEEEFVDLAVGIGSQAHFAVKRESALRYLRKAIEINPYREDANTAYMDSLAALGRRVEMVQHRRRYESLLREDLGIEPESSSEEGLTSRTDFFA